MHKAKCRTISSEKAGNDCVSGFFMYLFSILFHEQELAELYFFSEKTHSRWIG